jgi:wyosine [tRNA(Phe)-imidazoG37] synthetase (radical SAM superfamily)
MATFLFDDIIFGPVSSRRLGASLGINLLPVSRKFCNFNCIYCECGWSDEESGRRALPARADIRTRLEERVREILEAGGPLDRITFAGNGEPTIHPEFEGIIADTIEIRNRLAPGVGIAVLSNASRIDRPGIFEALGKIDMNILKLDSARESTVQIINQPAAGYSIDKVIEGMIRFNGRFILQTLFLKGEVGAVMVDNSSDGEVSDWMEMVRKVNPEMVMIYTLARDTPLQSLSKVSAEVLDSIAERVKAAGIPVQVSY